MKAKILAVFLLATTALTPVPAHAGIIEGIVFAISTIASSVGVGTIGTALLGQALVAGLSAVPGLLAGAALNFALNALFAPEAPVPTPQETRGNFLQGEAPRFLGFGRWLQGGSGMLCETKAGEIVKLIAHADCEATTTYNYYFNDIPVTINGSDQVTTDEFSYGDVFYYTLKSRAGTVAQAAQSELTSRFTEWTSDHKGAGVCDTLMLVSPVDYRHKAKVLRHSGVLRLGEPDIMRDALWGRNYDPRNDSTQSFGSGPERVDDPSTWSACTGNPALVFAAHRIHKERFANSPEDIYWANIAEQADICDISTEDRYGGFAPLYSLGMMINKKTETNIAAEDRILASCDGIRFTDEEGRIGLYVGKYDADPDLVLTDADVFEIESQDGEDGESLKTHYMASYVEPAYGMGETQSTVFQVPSYQEGDDASTGEIPLYQVQNHRQVCYLLEAAVLRQIEPRRLALIAGLRGKLAKRVRFLRLNLSDTSLNGVYEIADVKDFRDRLRVAIVLIRCDTDRWTPAAGQEGERPNLNIDISGDGDLANIAVEDMEVTSQAVAVEGSVGVRLIAEFPVPGRADIIVRIEHRLKTTTIWEVFNVRSEDGAGVSAVVPTGSTQEYRWRTETMGGNFSEWSATQEIVAIGNTTVPDDLTSAGATGGLGSFTYSLTTPATTNPPAKVAIYANTGGALDRETDLIETFNVAAGLPYNYAHGDTTRVNLLSNNSFDSGSTGWDTDDFTISGGEAVKSTGASPGYVRQSLSLTDGVDYRYGADVSAVPVGALVPRMYDLIGSSHVSGSSITSADSWHGTLTANSAVETSGAFGITAGTTSTGTVTALYLYVETETSLAGGTWQVWIEPQNGSGVAGTLEGPFEIEVY